MSNYQLAFVVTFTIAAFVTRYLVGMWVGFIIASVVEMYLGVFFINVLLSPIPHSHNGMEKQSERSSHKQKQKHWGKRD